MHKYAKAIKADASLAFSPQWSIRHEDAPFDYKYIAFYDPDMHRDMKVSQGDVGSGRVIVLSDSFEYEDWMHATKHEQVLEKSPARLTKVDVRFLGHDTNHAFASSAALFSLISSATAPEDNYPRLLEKARQHRKEKNARNIMQGSRQRLPATSRT